MLSHRWLLYRHHKLIRCMQLPLPGQEAFTEFVISSAQKEANKVIEKNQFTLITSKHDQKVFFDALMNPPKPNARLKKAVARYKKLSGKRRN